MLQEAKSLFFYVLLFNPTCSLFYKMTKKSGKNADFSHEKRVVF